MSNNETSRWNFVRMAEETNNKGKKISASTRLIIIIRLFA